MTILHCNQVIEITELEVPSLHHKRLGMELGQLTSRPND